jgi:RNA-binding motif X-linked protein 2
MHSFPPLPLACRELAQSGPVDRYYEGNSWRSAMNNIRNVESINEQELNAGIIGGLSKGSWHEEYKESAWVFFGGFPYELSEGDIICVMSQWGEIEDINLVRDKATNKSKGFAFVKYEDNRSTILAVDNFNGMKLLGRTLRCDHVQEYRLPKEVREKEMEALEDNPDGHVETGPGHAYKHIELATEHDVNRGVDLWRQPKSVQPANQVTNDVPEEREHKHKKHKKEHKEHKEHKEKKHKHDKRDREDRDDRDGDRPKHDRDRGNSREEGNVRSDRHDRSRRERSESRDRQRSRNSDRYDERTRADGRREDRPNSSGAASVPVYATTANRSAPPALNGGRAVPSGSGGFSASTGAVASWRGSRDPTASAAPTCAGHGGSAGPGKRPLDSHQGQSGPSNSSGGGPRRDLAPSGIGGANRVR